METKKANIVLCQTWSESERGWGIRPDGYSLHLTKEDLDAYIEAYWERMPKEVPYAYSSPDTKPYACIVSDEVLENIKKSDHGIYSFSRPYPQRIEEVLS